MAIRPFGVDPKAGANLDFGLFGCFMNLLPKSSDVWIVLPCTSSAGLEGSKDFRSGASAPRVRCLVLQALVDLLQMIPR